MSWPVSLDRKNGSFWPLEKGDAEIAKILKRSILLNGGSITIGQLEKSIYPKHFRNKNICRLKVSNCIYRWLWLNKVKTKFRNNYKVIKWKGSPKKRVKVKK